MSTIRRARRRGMMAGAVVASSKSKKSAQQQASSQAPQPSPSSDLSTDVVKQLNDLKDLLDKGILTQEEFDAKKKKILDL